MLAAAMLQSERWREALSAAHAARIVTVLRTPLLEGTPLGGWTDAVSGAEARRT